MNECLKGGLVRCLGLQDRGRGVMLDVREEGSKRRERKLKARDRGSKKTCWQTGMHVAMHGFAFAKPGGKIEDMKGITALFVLVKSEGGSSQKL